ncbi:MAG: FKBP-type peptidyl-prolyl cis-trans isomerase [Bacteroides sp.]|nr:FKBP-type peptidyl-prolyl cis-trans isomerase [Bacteroides sp.]
MKKSILWVIGLLFAVSFTVVSCEETTGVPDPYTDWENRNQLYIDSIAKVARANMGTEVGQWRVVHTYKFDPPLNDLNPDVNDYVYCKILRKGEGTITPLFTDTVGVHYRGKLIPLYDGTEVVFDQSFQGELNVDISIPMYSPSVDENGNVSDLTVGVKSVSMHMVEGDRWEVYVPYKLGYGVYDSGSVPGYSTLIFDWYMEDIRQFK